MNRIARAAVIGGIAMGAPILLAPSAMAAPEASAKKDINIFVVEKATVGHNGPVYVVESGPGDLAYSNVTDSPKASPKVGNKSVEAGDIKTTLKGGKNNTVVNEVEGSEQDSIKGGANNHQAEAKPEAAAQEAQAEEAKPEAAAQEAQAEEAKPEAAAHQAQAEEAKPEAAAQEAQAEEAKPEAAAHQAQAEEAKPEAAAHQAQAEEAKPEAGAQEGAQQQEARTGGHKDDKGGHGDHKGGPSAVFAAEKSTVGTNGPTVAVESGPGNLAFSNVTGSPKASPKVGNESVKTGDFHTHLKDGKGNTVVNEVEGAEQDSVK
ncbi:hypothetical protein GCM10010182_48520 [Actinomadura cremea]|nr:hypothetical protein GCM10010182_48520 [Actinomadura cremea]